MSRYSKLLTKIIAESGLTAKEVAEKCNELGNGIDTTRLSKLQNGKLPAPSEKVSRDISKVCNVDDRYLVIEGYLEKAPKEITDVFMSLKMTTTIAALHIFKNNIDKKMLNDIEQELNKEPLSDFIISLINYKENIVTNIETNSLDLFREDNDKFTLSLTEPVSLPVIDNAMYPIIPEHSKINLSIQEKYKNGDLLAFKLKSEDTDGIFVRYALFNNDTLILNPLNNQYKQLVVKKEDIIILGKVTQVITKL